MAREVCGLWTPQESRVRGPTGSRTGVTRGDIRAPVLRHPVLIRIKKLPELDNQVHRQGQQRANGISSGLLLLEPWKMNLVRWHTRRGLLSAVPGKAHTES